MQSGNRQPSRAVGTGIFLFSLLLWAQLVFGLGLTVWRLSLLNEGTAVILATDESPRVRQLGRLADEVCPPRADVAYVYGGEDSGYTTMRYYLFPRRIISVRAQEDVDARLRGLIAGNSVGCFVFYGAESGGRWQGERVDLDDSDYILVGPE